jgi:hypothetical protein
MARNLGISLLLFGLFLAGYDGFRVRENARQSQESNATTATPEDGRVHMSENGIIPPN